MRGLKLAAWATEIKVVLGVIGGSGFYQIAGLERVKQVELDHAVRPAVGHLLSRTAGRNQVVFLARHGRGHRILPSELNYRANIYGMKQLGVDYLVSVSTAGSMKEDLQPGRLGGARPVHRSHLQAAADLFRRRHRRARLAGRSGMSGLERDADRGEPASRCDGSMTVALTLYRGAAILDPRRIEPVSQLGRRRDQHDRDAGGAPRAGSRALLRGAGAGDGLRLLASGAARGRYRRDPAVMRQTSRTRSSAW